MKYIFRFTGSPMILSMTYKNYNCS